MKTNDKFDLSTFVCPDTSFAPVYIWVWNDVCTREIIDVQLAEMHNLGIRAFYILPEPKRKGITVFICLRQTVICLT